MQTLKLAFEAGDYDAARVAIHCLARLRDMLVNEAKVRFGKSMEAHKEPCRLLHILEELELMMRCHIDSSGLKLVFETAEALHNVIIRTDSAMLMSMMCNLISNAAKHCKEHILIQICVVAGWLRIQVIQHKQWHLCSSPLLQPYILTLPHTHQHPVLQILRA